MDSMPGRFEKAQSTACNDNGARALIRQPPRSVLTIARKACGSVLLSYVAGGCMIVARADRHRLQAA